MKRKRISKQEKKAIWDKTAGLCHLCGEKLFFDAKRGDKGRWHVDHILPFSLNGEDSLKNYLPICNVCNRLRWNFESKKMRELFRYGIISYKEVAKKSIVGIEIQNIYNIKLRNNKKRRKGNLSEEYYT